MYFSPTKDRIAVGLSVSISPSEDGRVRIRMAYARCQFSHAWTRAWTFSSRESVASDFGGRGAGIQLKWMARTCCEYVGFAPLYNISTSSGRLIKGDLTAHEQPSDPNPRLEYSTCRSQAAA